MNKVVHISRDDVSGGAGRCALRLHLGLRELGVDSRMLVARRRGSGDRVEQFRPPEDRLSRWRRALRRRRIEKEKQRYANQRSPGVEGLSDDRSPYGSDVVKAVNDASLVHLHWTSGLVDVSEFLGALPAAVPVVWTLHDMNPFTGGCHYAYDCDRFTRSCGSCPQLGSQEPTDWSSQIFARKRSIFETFSPDRLIVAAPSEWLASEARRSALFGRFTVEVIPYGIDTEAFAPRDMDAARDMLGIPRGATVILFVAESVASKRKGMVYLHRALKIMIGKNVEPFLLTVGKGGAAWPDGVAGRHVEYTADDRLLSIVYSAADVFVIPSVADNLPATVLEALSCGTPVAGFEVGGIPDMVRPGITGSLARPEDAGDLARAINDVVGRRETAAELGLKARQVALEVYSLRQQAERYSSLYESLIQDPGYAG